MDCRQIKGVSLKLYGELIMDRMKELEQLSKVIRMKNGADDEIARIIGRPALIGHTGEYVAAKVFNIELEQNAAHKAIDGRFTGGSLDGKTVNIKWYTKQEGILDVSPEAPPPDFYLVMTGAKTPAASSRGMTRPWLISQIFLFDARELLRTLRSRGVKGIGIATSIRREYWEGAEIYPTPNNNKLTLSDRQKEMLALFGEVYSTNLLKL